MFYTFLDFLSLLVLWIVNGFIWSWFLALANWTTLLLLPCCLVWIFAAPDNHRLAMLAVFLLAFLATALVPAPIPAVLSMMVLLGVVVVFFTQYNPDQLRWRATGGIGIYALAALGFALWVRYSGSVNATAWGNLMAQDEAAAMLAQGRSFVMTIATWGLQGILPLAYFGLLLQGLLVHPPTGNPRNIIDGIRGRGDF